MAHYLLRLRSSQALPVLVLVVQPVWRPGWPPVQHSECSLVRYGSPVLCLPLPLGGRLSVPVALKICTCFTRLH